MDSKECAVNKIAKKPKKNKDLYVENDSKVENLARWLRKFFVLTRA